MVAGVCNTLYVQPLTAAAHEPNTKESTHCPRAKEARLGKVIDSFFQTDHLSALQNGAHGDGDQPLIIACRYVSKS